MVVRERAEHQTNEKKACMSKRTQPFPLDYARALLSDYRMGIRRTVNNLALTYMPGADTTLQPRAMALFQAVVAGYLVVLSRSPRDLHANSDYNKGQSTLNDPPKPEGTL